MHCSLVRLVLKTVQVGLVCSGRTFVVVILSGNTIGQAWNFGSRACNEPLLLLGHLAWNVLSSPSGSSFQIIMLPLKLGRQNDKSRLQISRPNCCWAGPTGLQDIVHTPPIILFERLKPRWCASREYGSESDRKTPCRRPRSSRVIRGRRGCVLRMISPARYGCKLRC